MSTVVLVVDDDGDLIEGLSWYLEAASFEVVRATNGREALERFSSKQPDLVILDVMMPELDGVSVCERIRRQSTVPILMLSAREGEMDKIRALDKGADDYVTKPFSAAEVVSRLRALLRRTKRETQNAASLQWSGLAVYLDEHRVVVESKDVVLTSLEFDLLVTLMEQPKTVFNRNQLIRKVWGDGDTYHVGMRQVDNQIYRLREKLIGAGLTECPIVTIRGVGYAFRPEA